MPVSAATASGVNQEVINVGSGEETALDQLIELISATTGAKADVIYIRQAGRDRQPGGGPDQGPELLRYKPRTDSVEGLRKLYEQDPRFACRGECLACARRRGLHCSSFVEQSSSAGRSILALPTMLLPTMLLALCCRPAVRVISASRTQFYLERNSTALDQSASEYSRPVRFVLFSQLGMAARTIWARVAALWPDSVTPELFSMRMRGSIGRTPTFRPGRTFSICSMTLRESREPSSTPTPSLVSITVLGRLAAGAAPPWIPPRPACYPTRPRAILSQPGADDGD